MGEEADAAHAGPDAAAAAPGLDHAARRILEQGGETARLAADTAIALSGLAEAELALARAAAPRALLLALLAFALALAAALCGLALAVALLHRLGLDLASALAVVTAAALLAGLLLAWRAVQVWRLTRFSATRRQFARLLGDPP